MSVAPMLKVFISTEERVLREYNDRPILEVIPSGGTFPPNGYNWQLKKHHERKEKQFQELKRNIIRYERRKRYAIVKAELGREYLENLAKVASQIG